MPTLACMLTPKDLVVAVCDEGRAHQENTTHDPEAPSYLGLLCAHYHDAMVEWFFHRGVRIHDAQDLAGDFIARWLASNPMARFVPGPRPFRHFLARCLSNFLREHIERQRTQKRGGQAEHVPGIEDEQPAPEPPRMPLDEVHLAMAVFARAQQRLAADPSPDPARLMLLTAALDFRPECPPPPYEHIAAQTGLTVGNVKVRICRIREAFREAFKDECVRLGKSPGVAEAEMASLFNALLVALRQGL
jgi:DNA-directed RNA polymerase specialized sigma24 family protein